MEKWFNPFPPKLDTKIVKAQIAKEIITKTDTKRNKGEKNKSLHKNINISNNKTSTNSNNIKKERKLKKWWERIKKTPIQKINNFIQK